MKTDLNLHSYQRKALDRLNAAIEFKGLQVLEIGCGGSLSVARNLVRLGAETVVCLDNRRTGIPESSLNQIRYVSADVRWIPFHEASFNLLLGIAVLEHLPAMDQVAAEIYRVLKPGGVAYLTGGAFWTSHWGHHVYVVNNTARYCFDETNNPLPDWGHLLLDCEKMHGMLLEKGIPENHAEAIVEMVYQSEGLNRLSPVLIKNAFSGLPFEIQSQQSCWKKPGEDIREQLRKAKIPFLDELGIAELQLFLRKPNEANT